MLFLHDKDALILWAKSFEWWLWTLKGSLPGALSHHAKPNTHHAMNSWATIYPCSILTLWTPSIVPAPQRIVFLLGQAMNRKIKQNLAQVADPVALDIGYKASLIQSQHQAIWKGKKKWFHSSQKYKMVVLRLFCHNGPGDKWKARIIVGDVFNWTNCMVGIDILPQASKYKMEETFRLGKLCSSSST